MADKWKWFKLHSLYLKSPEWKQKREVILERDNHKCKYCGSTENLQIHHKSYKNWQNEREDELITLCSDCHAKIHNKNTLNKNPKRLGRRTLKGKKWIS